MFTESRAVFYHCVSPVHMGSGTALGVVDNPIQRERHSQFPVFAGSGIKGALRHHLHSLGTADQAKLNAVFGPESHKNAELHAGAISFTDAQLLAFPVRSGRQAYAYLTCPLALATAQRALALAKVNCNWTIPSVEDDHALTTSSSLGATSVALELFAFPSAESNDLKQIAQLLADHMPAGVEWDYFRKKLRSDLMLVSNTDFSYFVRNATSVEPHVSINNKTGAASDGLLFYTENLPPEAILLGLMLASQTRVRPSREPGAPPPFTMKADEVVQFATEALHGAIQFGGDATTGRGQVALKVAGGQQ